MQRKRAGHTARPESESPVLSDGHGDLVIAAQHSTGFLGDDARVQAEHQEIAPQFGVLVSGLRDWGRTAAATRDDQLLPASRLSIMYEWYAVRRGRYPGVYGSWEEANEQIHGYSNNCWRGFDDWHQAEDFINEASQTSSDAASGYPSGDPPQCDPYDAYELKFDGCARGNPGQAGCGAVIREHQTDALIGTVCWTLGHQTNNVAEYEALRRGVLMAVGLGIQTLVIYGDSRLCVKQVQDKWKVQARLRPYRDSVLTLLQQIPTWSIEWIPRSQNEEADNLANQALDSCSWEGLKDAEGICWTYNDLCNHVQVASRYPESEEDDAFAW